MSKLYAGTTWIKAVAPGPPTGAELSALRDREAPISRHEEPSIVRHKPPALAMAAALAASSFGAATAQAAPATSNPVSYLAVGDPYPAGWGVSSDQTYPIDRAPRHAPPPERTYAG